MSADTQEHLYMALRLQRPTYDTEAHCRSTIMGDEAGAQSVQRTLPSLDKFWMTGFETEKGQT